MKDLGSDICGVGRKNCSCEEQRDEGSEQTEVKQEARKGGGEPNDPSRGRLNSRHPGPLGAGLKWEKMNKQWPTRRGMAWETEYVNSACVWTGIHI